MSFTSIVKNEVSKLSFNDIEKLTTLSAIICNTIKTETNIKVSTENASVARLILSCIKELYNINPHIVVRKGYNYNKNYIYILEINHDIQHFLDNLGLIENNKVRITPASYIIDDEHLKRTFIRGIFLSSGSINDPKKSRYHLEIIVLNKEYADYIKDLLNHFNLNSKILKRENKYMVYIKEAEKIGDFLRIISASNAVLYYEDIRIYRDHKNMTNRLNNCEQANVNKIIFTANSQVKDIETIKENSFDLLDDKDKLIAQYRLKYKEVSLQELSEIISLETSMQISKSGLHHRFTKFKNLANKIKNSKSN